MTIFLIIYFIILYGLIYQTYKNNSKKNLKPPGELILVNGTRMHINSMGDGPQTIIMDSALGSSCLDWSWVQPKLASFAKVVTYDRAGYGWSEPSRKPRTSEQLVEELRELLAEAKVAPPYILVGHSFGGLNMRIFQQKYPEEVQGLFLIDSTPEELFSSLPKEYVKKLAMEKRMISAARWLAPLGILRLLNMPMGNFNLPKDKILIAKQVGYQTNSYITAYRELALMNQCMQQLSSLKTKAPLFIPIYVISRGTFQQGKMSEETMRTVKENWTSLQKNIAMTSDKHKHVLAKDCGHFIHCEEPELVVELILEMLKEEIPAKLPLTTF